MPPPSGSGVLWLASSVAMTPSVLNAICSVNIALTGSANDYPIWRSATPAIFLLGILVDVPLVFACHAYLHLALQLSIGASAPKHSTESARFATPELLYAQHGGVCWKIMAN